MVKISTSKLPFIELIDIEVVCYRFKEICFWLGHQKLQIASQCLNIPLRKLKTCFSESLLLCCFFGGIRVINVYFRPANHWTLNKDSCAMIMKDESVTWAHSRLLSMMWQHLFARLASAAWVVRLELSSVIVFIVWWWKELNVTSGSDLCWY